jgi:hypothetical protein
LNASFHDPSVRVPPGDGVGTGFETSPASVRHLSGRETAHVKVAVKRCARCRQTLPAEAFRPNPKMRTGLSSCCQSRSAARTRRWREANPEYVAAYAAARRTPPARLVCSECGREYEGRRGRLVCSRKCKDARYKRRHPEAFKAKRARYDRRRKERERAPYQKTGTRNFRISSPRTGRSLAENPLHPPPGMSVEPSADAMHEGSQALRPPKG